MRSDSNPAYCMIRVRWVCLSYNASYDSCAYRMIRVLVVWFVCDSYDSCAIRMIRVLIVWFVVWFVYDSCDYCMIRRMIRVRFVWFVCLSYDSCAIRVLVLWCVVWFVCLSYDSCACLMIWRRNVIVYSKWSDYGVVIFWFDEEMLLFIVSGRMMVGG